MRHLGHLSAATYECCAAGRRLMARWRGWGRRGGVSGKPEPSIRVHQLGGMRGPRAWVPDWNCDLRGFLRLRLCTARKLSPEHPMRVGILSQRGVRSALRNSRGVPVFRQTTLRRFVADGSATPCISKPHVTVAHVSAYRANPAASCPTRRSFRWQIWSATDAVGLRKTSARVTALVPLRSE